MAKARKNLDWDKQLEIAIDPEHAREIRQKVNPHISDVCSMCGKYCAIKLLSEALTTSEKT